MARAFVLVLAFATFLSFVQRFLPVVLVDSIRSDIGISDLQFSSLQSAFAISFVLATLSSGWVTDRVNRRNLLLLGVAAFTGGAIAFGLAGSLAGLVAARLLIGVGEAVLVPAGISLLCDLVHPDQRGRAISLTFFGATLGTALAFSGGGWLLEGAKAGWFASVPLLGALPGWRQVVLLLAAPGLMIIPVLLLFKEPARSFAMPLSGRQRMQFLWRIRRVFVLALLMGASIAIADFAYTTWQTAHLTRSHGMSVGAAGQSLGLTALLVGTVGAWIGGQLSDRMHAKRGAAGRVEVVLGCAIILGASAVLVPLPHLAAAVAAYAIWQMAANVAYVAHAVTLQDIVTDETRGLATSLSICLSVGIGLGVGPALIAFANQWIGGGENALGPTLAFAIALLATLTIAIAALLRHRLRSENISEYENSA